jgi:hypothetical protein
MENEVNTQVQEAVAPPAAEQPAAEPVAGYCRTCGKALTESTKRAALGTLFCTEHAPHVIGAAGDPGSPYTAPVGSATPISASPALAFFLGFIPGVGAIYNGQYGKGFIHVVVFGLLISIASSDNLAPGIEPLFGMLAGAFVFYQCFEAYHTARNRAEGKSVDEFSSIVPLKGAGAPVGPVVLIGLGVIFLLNNLGLLRFSQILRFWPVLLIVIGAGMLMNRLRGGQGPVEGGEQQ